jgi:hypothetical protein
VAFGLACLGAQPGPDLLQALGDSLVQGLGQPALPLRDLAIRAWSLAVLGSMTGEVWGQLVGCVARRQGGFGRGGDGAEMDDAAALFFLHAAMLAAGVRG